jgi:hypothetical protein
MKQKRFVFLWLLIWECLKIILLMAAAGALFHNTLLLNRSGVFWLVLLGSGSLVIPLLDLLLFLRLPTYANLLPIVKIGKIITALPCFLLLVGELSRRLIFSLNFIFLPFPVSSSLFLFIIFSIDLIFLSVIISLKEETRRD